MKFLLRKELKVSSLTIFTKTSIIDIWQGSKYASELYGSICCYNTDDNTAPPGSEIQLEY